MRADLTRRFGLVASLVLFVLAAQSALAGVQQFIIFQEQGALSPGLTAITLLRVGLQSVLTIGIAFWALSHLRVPWSVSAVQALCLLAVVAALFDWYAYTLVSIEPVQPWTQVLEALVAGLVLAFSR